MPFFFSNLYVHDYDLFIVQELHLQGYLYVYVYMYMG